MYCDSCGGALQPGQTYCTRCGKQVIGPIVAGSGRVARHTHLLGVLWIAYSVFVLIIGGVMFVLANIVMGRMGPWGPGMPPGAPFFMHGLFTSIGVLLALKGGAGILAGVGLLQRQGWARVLAIVVGILALLSVPIGTAIGVYTLWVLLSPNADAEYHAMAHAAGA